MQDDTAESLAAAIAALQTQRETLGDAVLEQALAPLRARLAQLQTDAEAQQRLRQVSVLFVDVVGLAPLQTRLDVEAVAAVLAGARAAFTALIVRHGGEVLRYGEESIKAAFGADRRREDDAERAVTCGLALLQEAARQADALQQAHGLAGFGARVGIHTGAVVRGGGPESDSSLSGLAVNIAARMEQTAPTGSLRISIDTQRQVQGRFEVQEQPPLVVKGLTEPMRTFLVLAPRDRRLHGLRHAVDGVASALVGRADELLTLQALVAATCAPGGGLAWATVVGEAGLGKSRLLAEVQAGAAATARAPMVLRAASHPQALNQAYGLLRDLLFWHHGVRDSDSQQAAQQTFTAALVPIFGADAPEQTALLGQLIGLDFAASPFVAGILRDGRQLRLRGLNAWLRYLQALAAVQPLLLLLDDLQWADDASLDALGHIAGAAPQLPVVLLCAARPVLMQRRADWGSARPGHRSVVLSPLADADGEALASALLVRFDQPQPALQLLLVEQAAGNPFYMESLLQMLVDTGVVQTDGAHWQVQPGRLQALQVPPTLVGVFQATLDTLEPAQRRSLQQASVVGAQFWDQALAAIDPRSPDELLAISRRELALPQDPSAFDGARQYAFRHHLLHQVTYGTVLKGDKREGHLQAALWLERRGAGREGELAPSIADHFERAGESARAAEQWLRAAEHASRRHADSAALAHAQRALALLQDDDARAHHVRAQVLMRASDAAGHQAALAQLEALAERLDDDRLRVVIAHDRAWYCNLDARFEEALRVIEPLLSCEAARASADGARLHNQMFMALSQLKRTDEAEAHALQGIAKARAAGDRATEAAFYNNLAVNHRRAERFGAAREWLDKALETYTAAGSRYGACTTLLNLAELSHGLCRLELAREQYTRQIVACRAIGFRGMEAMGLANLAIVQGEQGDGAGALENARLALALSELTGDRFARTYAHRGIRQAARLLGLHAEVIEHATAARQGFVDHNNVLESREEASAAVVARLALGERELALSEAEALLAEVQDGGWQECMEAPMNLYQVLKALDDPRADELLQVAWRKLCAEADDYASHVPREDYLDSSYIRRLVRDTWASALPTG